MFRSYKKNDHVNCENRCASAIASKFEKIAFHWLKWICLVFIERGENQKQDRKDILQGYQQTTKFIPCKSCNYV